MKICFLAGTLGRGGAERQLIYMMQAVINGGFSVRLLSLTRGEALEAEIRALGIEIDFVGKSPNRLRRLYAIIKNLRQNPADALQSAHFYTNIYAGLAGRILKIPAVGAIRSDLHSELKMHGRLGKYQLTMPQHLIVNSEKAFLRAVDCGIKTDQITFVKNAVKTIQIERKKISDELNVLFVGRLIPLKRPEIFVRLAKKLEENLPHRKLNFLIVGDGELRSELETQAKNLNLRRNRILFLGQREDVGEIYRRGDLLVLTSLYEGTPNAVLEAMSYGLPVIAADVGGVAEIVNARRGILVDCADEEKLFQAVAAVVTDDDLRWRLGTNGREYTEVNHSPENLEKQLAAIYRKISVKK